MATINLEKFSYKGLNLDSKPMEKRLNLYVLSYSPDTKEGITEATEDTGSRHKLYGSIFIKKAFPNAKMLRII